MTMSLLLPFKNSQINLDLTEGQLPRRLLVNNDVDPGIFTVGGSVSRSQAKGINAFKVTTNLFNTGVSSDYAINLGQRPNSATMVTLSERNVNCESVSSIAIVYTCASYGGESASGLDIGNSWDSAGSRNKHHIQATTSYVNGINSISTTITEATPTPIVVQETAMTGGAYNLLSLASATGGYVGPLTLYLFAEFPLLSDVAAKEISVDPWQIFEPKRKFFYINAELMLTLQGLTQAQNLDTTQLTQQNILSTLGISQSQNLGTADLTQQNTLSPAEILQTQSLSGVSLTQQNLISLAGLAQAQTLGAAELTQQNILNPTGLSQAQILDAFDLTVAGGAAPSIAVFSRPNTAQGVLEGPIIPKLNSDFSDMELCLLGGRKEGVGGPIRDFEFYEDCGFKTGTIGPGQGPLSATAEGAITFANSEKLKSGTLSGVAVFEFTTVPNYGFVFGTMFGYDPDYPLGGLDVYTLANGTVAMNQYEGSSAMVSSSSGKILARKPSTVAWSYNGSTGLAQLWVNGSYYSATTVRDTSTTNSTGALGGFKEGDPDGVGKKVFHLCAVWGRDMTPAEVISLGENPWQIFQPERKVFFLPQAELSLVPQGLSNTQQLDQPALTQQSLLSVNGAAQAQVLGALSLTQQNTISPSALTQSQVLGVISLVSQSTLAMNELSQSQTISAIALTQQGALAVTNMAQGQTLEGLSLAQQNLLSVAGANSAQNLSSPTLAFGAFLSVESAQQAQALGTISLVQQNILAVNGVASSQSLGSIALQQANVLSVQAQVQSQSLGVLDLVFQAYLAPNSIANSQTIDNLSLVQANILQVYGLSQDQLLESINLSQDSWLIVDDVLHQQIATNIHLLNGAAVLRVAGSIVYVLGSKAPVFVLNSSAKILVTAG